MTYDRKLFDGRYGTIFSHQLCCVFSALLQSWHYKVSMETECWYLGSTSSTKFQVRRWRKTLNLNAIFLVMWPVGGTMRSSSAMAATSLYGMTAAWWRVPDPANVVRNLNRNRCHGLEGRRGWTDSLTRRAAPPRPGNRRIHLQLCRGPDTQKSHVRFHSLLCACCSCRV